MQQSNDQLTEVHRPAEDGETGKAVGVVVGGGLGEAAAEVRANVAAGAVVGAAAMVGAIVADGVVGGGRVIDQNGSQKVWNNMSPLRSVHRARPMMVAVAALAPLPASVWCKKKGTCAKKGFSRYVRMRRTEQEGRKKDACKEKEERAFQSS